VITLGLWAGALIALVLTLNLAATTGRTNGSVFRRTWSGTFASRLGRGAEKAILEFQAIEEPFRRHALDQKGATQIEEEGEGGPDDPGPGSS
jgi:hypothetical protein